MASTRHRVHITERLSLPVGGYYQVDTYRIPGGRVCVCLAFPHIRFRSGHNPSWSMEIWVENQAFATELLGLNAGGQEAHIISQGILPFLIKPGLFVCSRRRICVFSRYHCFYAFLLSRPGVDFSTCSATFLRCTHTGAELDGVRWSL